MPEALHPAVRDLLSQLGDVAPGAVADAEAALEWMLDGRDLGAITQFGLQQFLWYELPFKWMVEPAQRQEIALNLASFLEVAGFPRYAAIARDERTRQVIEAWDPDVDEGYRAFREAMSASGVEPPDLPEIRWGIVMGRAEYDAFWSTAAALELAVVAGDLPTVGRRAADARVEVARQHLTTERIDLAGESLLVGVERERIAAWANVERNGARAMLVDPVVNQIIAPVEQNELLVESLRPLRLLLEAADEGLELTARGYLPRQFVVDLASQFDWLLPGHQRPRGEIDVPQVGALHELVRTRRLVRRRGSSLLLTTRGREMLSGERALTAEVASAVVGEGFEAAAAEVLLASMLCELHRSQRDRCAEAAVALTEEGWSVRGAPSGSPVPNEVVDREFDRLWQVCSLFGWVVRDRAARHVDLTPEGRMGARCALRSLAAAPRTQT